MKHTRQRPRALFTTFGLLLATLTTACAGYNVSPIDPDGMKSWGTGDDGYVIYEPDPYLRVVRTTVDGKEQVAADIVYLPNKQRPYRVSTYAWLATADIKLTYRDGWLLTNAESNVDTASVAKAVIEAVGDSVSLFTDEREPSSTTVTFYRLKFDGGVVVGCVPAFAIP